MLYSAREMWLMHRTPEVLGYPPSPASQGTCGAPVEGTLTHSLTHPAAEHTTCCESLHLTSRDLTHKVCGAHG